MWRFNQVDLKFYDNFGVVIDIVWTIVSNFNTLIWGYVYH
jgi:hypothetical protein